MRERRELQVPAEHMTDEQIASAIRYLDPDRDSKRSDLDTAGITDAKAALKGLEELEAWWAWSETTRASLKP
jgi:hypothetical protein